MRHEVKKKRAKQNGFVLIVVITSFALIAAEMFILTGGSNVILFQADNAYLEACRQNLTASALAWAEQNAGAETSKNPDEKISLDVSSLCKKHASLEVKINKAADGIISVQIETTCQSARQTIRDKKEYHLTK